GHFSTRRVPHISFRVRPNYLKSAAILADTPRCPDLPAPTLNPASRGLSVSKSMTKTSWLTDMLAGIAMASGVGYVAAAYSVSRWLTRATPGKPQRTPGDLGLAWEPLECTTADYYRLKGWVATPSQPRGTVLLFHGVRNNREQTLGRTAFLAAAGYQCVAFDHRAHGESGGRRTSFGYHESRDVVAVLDLVRQTWPRQRCAVLGISMGAAALCYAADAVRGCA